MHVTMITGVVSKVGSFTVKSIHSTLRVKYGLCGDGNERRLSYLSPVIVIVSDNIVARPKPAKTSTVRGGVQW